MSTRSMKTKKNKKDVMPPDQYRLHDAFFFLVKWFVFRVFLQVLVDLSRQNQLYIFHRGVVDQVVQLGAFVSIAGDRFFDGNSVDGDRNAVVVFDLHAGVVDVVFAGYSFHIKHPSFRLQDSRRRDICRMCETVFLNFRFFYGFMLHCSA